MTNLVSIVVLFREPVSLATRLVLAIYSQINIFTAMPLSRLHNQMNWLGLDQGSEGYKSFQRVFRSRSDDLKISKYRDFNHC